MFNYLLVSYDKDTIYQVDLFQNEDDDLQFHPYDGSVEFPVGSNQQIVKEEDASVEILRQIMKKQFSCELELKPMRNFFDFESQFKEVILGFESGKTLSDGEITEINFEDDIDWEVKKELEKLGIRNPKLSTFVQWVSNDNC